MLHLKLDDYIAIYNPDKHNYVTTLNLIMIQLSGIYNKQGLKENNNKQSIKFDSSFPIVIMSNVTKEINIPSILDI